MVFRPQTSRGGDIEANTRPRLRRSRADRSVVAGYLALGAAFVLAWAVAASASLAQSAAAPSGAVTQLNAEGQGLYLQSCAACHGPQGAGTTNGPDIRNAGAALADFMVRTGRMPLAEPGAPVERGQPRFDDQGTEAIVAYVASLGQGPAIPAVVTQGADVANGRALYVANCAACHGPAGGGGAVGGGFVAPPLTQADATTVGEAAVTGPDPMPRFSFGPKDLNDVAAYIEYLRNAPHPGGATGPAVGPVTEGFIAALALVALLLIARWVGVRQRSDR
jgi:ubiquinol-cytochrome c reductase cytochrome c subunit